MAWRERNVDEERVRFVILASRKEKPFSELCREFEISRPTGYLWLARYREGGAKLVLEQRSRRPLRSPRQTAAAIEQVVAALRRQRPDWGAAKLEDQMRCEHPELLCPSVPTLHRILLRNNLVAPQDRHQQATKRFERSQPNELWQMDFKGPQGNQRMGPLSVLDDHSRYLLVLRALNGVAGEPVRRCLEETFERVGLPEGMLMDHGTPWWNARGPWGWTEFSVWLMQQGIRIHLSGIRHPQTQGKVERMHRALKAAAAKRNAPFEQQAWLDEFREEYNTLRPHAALQMQTPATRWHPSPRPFQPNPRAWEYPPGCVVARLGSVGQLHWRGHRFEISYALKNQLVGIEQIADSAIVYFCNTPLRELDPVAATSTALPLSPFPNAATP
jgi:transposase InsO family protein